MEENESSEKALMDRIYSILSEYRLNGLQRAATMKFIKEKIGDQSCTSVMHIRS